MAALVDSSCSDVANISKHADDDDHDEINGGSVIEEKTKTNHFYFYLIVDRLS